MADAPLSDWDSMLVAMERLQTLSAMRERGLLVEVDGEFYATRRGERLAAREERRERIQRAAALRWSHERRRKAA